MAIRRCLNCGKPFTPKKSKLIKFCSFGCRDEFREKQKTDNDWMETQFDIDFKARQKARKSDYRILRR